jgi:hypothetical protein
MRRIEELEAHCNSRWQRSRLEMPAQLTSVPLPDKNAPASPEQSGGSLQRGVAWVALNALLCRTVITSAKASGPVSNQSVVSETFAQTGKVFFCGLRLSEVKAALLSGALRAPCVRVSKRCIST